MIQAAHFPFHIFHCTPNNPAAFNASDLGEPLTACCRLNERVQRDL
jgi:hypothetical protein